MCSIQSLKFSLLASCNAFLNIYFGVQLSLFVSEIENPFINNNIKFVLNVWNCCCHFATDANAWRSSLFLDFVFTVCCSYFNDVFLFIFFAKNQTFQKFLSQKLNTETDYGTSANKFINQTAWAAREQRFGWKVEIDSN